MVLSRADHGLQQHGLCLAGGVVNLFAAYERRRTVHVVEGDRPFAELAQHGLVRACRAEGRRRPGRLGRVFAARAGEIVAGVAVGIACKQVHPVALARDNQTGRTAAGQQEAGPFASARRGKRIAVEAERLKEVSRHIRVGRRVVAGQRSHETHRHDIALGDDVIDAQSLHRHRSADPARDRIAHRRALLDGDMADEIRVNEAAIAGALIAAIDGRSVDRPINRYRHPALALHTANIDVQAAAAARLA